MLSTRITRPQFAKFLVESIENLVVEDLHQYMQDLGYTNYSKLNAAKDHINNSYVDKSINLKPKPKSKGIRILEMLQTTKLTHQEIADKIGSTKGSVASYASNLKRISPKTLEHRNA